MSRYEAIREECRAANAALPASGLVDLTFGNVSVCDREAGVFAIKPSGVAYSALRIEDMAFRALTLDPSAKPPSLALSERHFLRKHGPTATYGQA